LPSPPIYGSIVGVSDAETTQQGGAAPAAAREIDARALDFASGLLVHLIEALRSTAQGDLVAITGHEGRIGADLEAWARFTGNAIVAASRTADGAARWVVRNGPAPAEDPPRPVGSRLWLYTNFDCNLACDYCCVRSSPEAPRRELGLAAVERVAREAPPLGVREIFVTGGEPMLLPDLADVVRACVEAAPTTVLTNAMLYKGERARALAALPRDRVTLQVSLDSPTPELHDLHRGAGTWERAWRGARAARDDGFRVRLAATVRTDAEARAIERFLDHEQIPAEDRVVRRVAMRGFAAGGVALGRADLVPEVTITAAGVYWHPVGAEDDDLLVTRDIFPLAAAFDAVREAAQRERALGDRIASIFHCA
jgi:pyruvate-formate lyase-activating enzyme